ncbi:MULTISPECIES: glycosyltransferase family 4 protein [unclassified Tolypothrix]|uniref:glycosyltransferase family 4 protein n=1 Tax=unclassified Tolypothrix TaxID=2649714 RepID=UPI0005EAA397|nr:MULTISPECIES: glycosyltransferase family 4 protein [unclassified Tolypothrix]BAY88764.1 group 1 glycosyl transferase [Microchaete diplosiphon NIES-3275]EKF01653.1 group 1 glycosyltransferase [Tolypothrix sp. PCC 7601]MBE9086456.1 glycosyltransferase [Tolypothrix sp. LEGE 11397]UYD29424.1 glycosyltransferase [Tolypothrix sp. PCC 7712]UYD34668.1 glycosyltransferase [Tolypothrix sp. PCC 7601]
MAKVIIAGERHLSTPNLPRTSQHILIRPKQFPSGRYPLEKIWYPLNSFSYWQPFWKKFQVVHAFNRIEYTNKPWFVTFEDHRFLYRNPQNKLEEIAYPILNNRLALKNCQKIIAISDYAKMRFANRVSEWNISEKLKNKLTVIHPNFAIKAHQPKTYKDGENIELIFVGNHLARKGGIVALRLAKKAEALGLPIKVHIISNLRYGSGVPTDFPDQSKYTADLKLLDLDNVVFHKSIPNEKVLDLLAQSHFQILATLHDTYGYSVLEGFSVATPAITTNICALPEFVHDDENGYHLKLPLNEIRHWNNWLHGEKTKTNEYWEILNSTYDDLAEQALQKILHFLERTDKQEHYASLSAGALTQMQNYHNAEKQNELFDSLYAEAAALN